VQLAKLTLELVEEEKEEGRKAFLTLNGRPFDAILSLKSNSTSRRHSPFCMLFMIDDDDDLR
jgi:hypothetical protein